MTDSAPALRLRGMVEPARLPLDDIVTGDCLAALARLPAASIDLVFADPPYNLQLSGELHRQNNSRVDGVSALTEDVGPDLCGHLVTGCDHAELLPGHRTPTYGG